MRGRPRAPQRISPAPMRFAINSPQWASFSKTRKKVCDEAGSNRIEAKGRRVDPRTRIGIPRLARNRETDHVSQGRESEIDMKPQLRAMILAIKQHIPTLSRKILFAD